MFGEPRRTGLAGGGQPSPGSQPWATPPQDEALAGDALEIKRNAGRWLVIAVAAFWLCLGTNCLGVIGAILCFLAMQAAEHGNVDDARSKLKWAKIGILVGSAISFLIWLSVLLVRVRDWMGH